MGKAVAADAGDAVDTGTERPAGTLLRPTRNAHAAFTCPSLRCVIPPVTQVHHSRERAGDRTASGQNEAGSEEAVARP